MNFEVSSVGDISSLGVMLVMWLLTHRPGARGGGEMS